MTHTLPVIFFKIKEQNIYKSEYIICGLQYSTSNPLEKKESIT